MMKNASGFTMIELLAAVVVLGILATFAVTITMRVLQDQRNKTYVDDSIRLASNMDYKMRSDNKMPVPARGACIAMNLTYLDNNTFNDAPYDGEYDRLSSFVIAKRNTDVTSDTEYFYYVRLIEKTKTGTYRGVSLAEVEQLYEDDAKDVYVSNVLSGNAVGLTVENASSLLSEYGISCAGGSGESIIIYAPDASNG